jgi:hypothetical protein
MARARNIKPKFLSNEVLAKLDPIISLLFIGLWMLADREGRLEDRPDRILAEAFPARREITDISGYLTVLAQYGFIDRYKVGKQTIIQVVNFKKHQSPHVTEKPSDLPAKPIDSPITVELPLNNGAITEPLPPDSLIPDSLNPDSLNPDSLIPDSVSDADASSSSRTDDPPPAVVKPKPDPIPYKKIVDLYHQLLPMCPRIGALTTTRKSYIAARWKSGAIPDLDTWHDFFIFVSKSKFLTGACDPPEGKKRFVADLEWMTRESNFVKIYEKKYHGQV